MDSLLKNNHPLHQCFVEIAKWATIEQIYIAQRYAREAALAGGYEYLDDNAGLEAALVKLLAKHERLRKRTSHSSCRLCYGQSGLRIQSPPSPVSRASE